MTIENQYNEHLNQGHNYVTERDWARAGVAFCRAATLAFEASHYPEAATAWDTGGEALRRADKPIEALQAFQAALRFCQESNAATVAIKLAAAATDIGDFELGKSLCEEAAQQQSGQLIGFIALDSLCGILIALGDIDNLRGAVAQLEAAPEPLKVGGLFRAAQLARLDGKLTQATAYLESARTQLDIKKSPAGIAGIEGELAEISELQGSPSSAAEHYLQASNLLGEAERQSLAFRMQAANIRAMVNAGLDTLWHPLNRGITYAQERHMPILETDLRLARGMAIASNDPRAARFEFREAAKTAIRFKVPFREGRAKLEEAKLDGKLADRIDLLKQAERALLHNRPWLWRARLLQLELLGLNTHEAWLAFREMGMIGEADRALQGSQQAE